MPSCLLRLPQALTSFSLSFAANILVFDIIRGALCWPRRSVRIIGSLVSGVLSLAPGILDLSFRLLCRTLNLHLGVICPFASLTFDATCYVFHFAFNSILIHV